jgi:DNA transformation protein
MAARTPQPAFVDHCVELLSPLGTVRVKRMFGGWGLYIDELFMAIVASERLYLKAAPEARELFAAAGCEPFVYSSDGQSVALGYWSAPADALDSPALMLPWARLALQAALAARAAKAVRPSAPARAKTTSAAAPAKARATRARRG